MDHVFGNYGRWDLEIVSGKGANVTGADGKKYLDFTSGIGVCNLGHCHEAPVLAVEEQLHTLWHVSNLFNSSLQEETAEKLVPSDEYVAFFCNSGAEANEAAIKLARKYTGKHKIITFNQSFHGRTLGTLAATGQDKVKEGFGPLLETFVHCPFNDLDALRSTIDGETAAVMLEVIQGEGGVHVADEEFLKGAEKLCQDHGLLLIVDEVQTGIGRTGKKFGYEHYGISPDIITSAKGLGNGFPVGAMIGKKKLGGAFGPGSHGSTYGGNPLAMRAAGAVLGVMESPGFYEEVTEKGEWLKEQAASLFAKVEGFKEVRGIGLMLGIEFADDTTSWIKSLRENGLLVLPAGPNVIRFLPSLTISREELKKGLDMIQKTILEKSACETNLV